jgi:predicted Ser/Thr protein kinase
MSHEQHHNEEVQPVEKEVGGDDGMPGISQELTTDDIDDVVFDTTISLAGRREQLMGLPAEICARRASDHMGDMSEILAHLEDRIASLSSPQESETFLESAGMDADSRSDGNDPAYHIDDEDGCARAEDLGRRSI